MSSMITFKIGRPFWVAKEVHHVTFQAFNIEVCLKSGSLVVNLSTSIGLFFVLSKIPFGAIVSNSNSKWHLLCKQKHRSLPNPTPSHIGFGARHGRFQRHARTFYWSSHPKGQTPYYAPWLSWLKSAPRGTWIMSKFTFCFSLHFLYLEFFYLHFFIFSSYFLVDVCFHLAQEFVFLHKRGIST